MRMRCGSCAGEYDSIFPDGTRYFHACGPVNVTRVTRAGATIDVPISTLKPDDLVTVQRDGKNLEVPIAAMQPGDLRQGDRNVPRQDARNENIDPRKANTPHPIVAEGNGAIAVP